MGWEKLLGNMFIDPTEDCKMIDCHDSTSKRSVEPCNKFQYVVNLRSVRNCE